MCNSMTDDDVILAVFFVMVHSLFSLFFCTFISKLIICLFQIGKLFPSNVIKKWDKLY